VFSPYYAAAFQREGAQVNPENHCALNVALYGAAGKRWTMTERGVRHIIRERTQFNIGPSRMQWLNDHLEIDIDEVAMPLPRRVRGSIRVYPQALCTYNAALDDKGRHRWGPIAPCARIEVAMDSPAASWKGQAYLDSNEGDEPVSGPFKVWDWSRAAMADGSTAVIYDVQLENGHNRLLAERFKPNGEVESFEPSARQPLPTTLWQVGRSMRSEVREKGALPYKPASVKETLEDTPFYARSLVNATLLGERVTAVHETLQPQRLKAWPMSYMLPFRMPRRS
jgi:carotenoid 1,2-hydratase